jgi:hypothetical protein
MFTKRKLLVRALFNDVIPTPLGKISLLELLGVVMTPLVIYLSLK